MARSSVRGARGTVRVACLAVPLLLLLAGLAVSTGAAAPRSSPVVSLSASRVDVTVGHRVSLRGRTSVPRGSRVLVQRRTASQEKYRTVHRTRVDRRGRFSYSERPETAGRYRLRACVRRGHRICSTPLRVEVSEVESPEPQWYYLHDKGPVTPAAGEWCERPETLAGVVHPKSVAFGANCHDNGENYGELALDGACSRFEAVIGLSDASTEDSRYDVHVLVDGVEVYGRLGLSRGQAEAVAVDLTGAQRLRLTGPFVAGRLGNVVFGDARVWCDF